MLFSLPKSTLTSTKMIDFIGANPRLVLSKGLPSYRQFSGCEQPERSSHPLPLLGYMAASTYITLCATLHLFCLQTWFWSGYTLDKDNMNTRITIPQKVRAFLIWWTKLDPVRMGVPLFSPTPSRTIIMDASLIERETLWTITLHKAHGPIGGQNACQSIGDECLACNTFLSLI